MAAPATAQHPARIWYRHDGLLHDAHNTLLDGWVCEEVDVTPRINPWSWEGYETIFKLDTPQQSLASFFRAIDHFSENERQHYEVMANLSDQGPIKRHLYEIINRNHDGKMTAQELQTAIALPAHAQSLSQLIIHCES